MNTLLVINGSTPPDTASRRTSCDDQWNVDSVRAVLSPIWDLKMSPDIGKSAVRQKYMTNQALDRHRRPPLSKMCALDTGAHSPECRARFEIIWIKELTEGEIARYAADKHTVRFKYERD